MNLTHLLETWGDAAVLASLGALVGLAFGWLAQRSRFCARAAVMECAQGRPGKRFGVWWLGFGAALLGTQVLVLAGGLTPSASRWVGATGSLSGAVVGGLCFGAGMILTRGCASRLLILSANGNLRALLAGLVFAVTVQASMGGGLAPLRQYLFGLWAIDAGPARDLNAALGTGPWGAAAIAALLFASGVYVFWRQHGPRLGLGLAAVGTGLCIAAGWGITQAVASTSFEAIAVASLSFSAPSAEWLMRVLSSSHAPGLGFDSGLLPATFVGSLLAGLWAGEFKFEGFKAENKLGHYLTGAVLMGFGAVLAAGCTVGAGMSGGALFATTAWLTLASIWAGAWASIALHRRMGWAF